MPWREPGAPALTPTTTRLLLAVEILSPSTARADRQRKRAIYQSEGVPEYWIVDVDARLAERWRPGDERPKILATTLEWQPRADQEALALGRRSDPDAPRDQLAGQSETVIAMSGRSATSAPS